MPKLSLDTNILVYAVDRTDGHKNAVARSIIVHASQTDIVLTQQVLGEYLNVVRKSDRDVQPALRETAERFERLFIMVPTPKSLLLHAFDRSVRYQLQYWDALIVSVCLENQVTHLLTEDLQDGQIIDGLTVLNPFAEHNRAAIDRLFVAED
jgi:predicted nucleic acid-binding protein